MTASDRTIRWIENLAEQELLIKSGERSTIDIAATKEEVLSVEMATFVRHLLYHFEYLVQLFNSRVANEAIQIKVIRNIKNSRDFSLSRNRMTLILRCSQPGRIQLTCEKEIEDLSVPKKTVMFSGCIEAGFGTFHEVEWHFLGNPVSAEQVARHYLTEFIQMSRFSTTDH